MFSFNAVNQYELKLLRVNMCTTIYAQLTSAPKTYSLYKLQNVWVVNTNYCNTTSVTKIKQKKHEIWILFRRYAYILKFPLSNLRTQATSNFTVVWASFFSIVKLLVWSVYDSTKDLVVRNRIICIWDIKMCLKTVNLMRRLPPLWL